MQRRLNTKRPRCGIPVKINTHSVMMPPTPYFAAIAREGVR
jgi:hypothetical protein